MTKYKAKPVKADGYRFGSKAEYARYKLLKRKVELGLICDLKIHPRFPLIVRGIKIARYYEADFQYKTNEGTVVVEDVKGVVTRVYAMKKKLMLAIHGIEIREVKPGELTGDV